MKEEQVEQVWRSALNNFLPQRVFFKDAKLVYRRCNDAFARDLKRRPDEVVGKTDADLFAPELVEKYRADDRAVMASGMIKMIEEEYVIDGKEAWVQTMKFPVKDETGAAVGVLGVFWNVTERRLAQQEIERQQMELEQEIAGRTTELSEAIHHLQEEVNARLQAEQGYREANEKLEVAIGALHDRNRAVLSMLDDVEQSRIAVDEERAKLASSIAAMSEGLVLIDETGDVLLSNEAAQMMFDGPEGEALRWEHVCASSWFPQEEFMRVVFESGDSYTAEFVARKAPLRILQVSASLLDGERHAAIALMTVTDVTRQRELDRAKDELITTVSHELRTPLALIKLFLSNAIIGSMGEFGERMTRGLQRADAASNRLAALIDGLLEYSRLRKARFILEAEACSILDIVDGVRTLYEPMMAEYNRHFEVIGELKNPELRCDPRKIHQAIGNLLDNAIKYSSEGGRIVLELSDTVQTIEVRVSDTGIGIPREYQSVIFERFRQVERKYAPGTQGLGLGLAIVKEIVERHGGTVRVESDPGKGSIFAFTLSREGPEESSDEGDLARDPDELSMT